MVIEIQGNRETKVQLSINFDFHVEFETSVFLRNQNLTVFRPCRLTIFIGVTC